MLAMNDILMVEMSLVVLVVLHQLAVLEVYLCHDQGDGVVCAFEVEVFVKS